MTEFFLNGIKILKFNFESKNFKVKATSLDLEDGTIMLLHNFQFGAENSVLHQWSEDDVTK